MVAVRHLEFYTFAFFCPVAFVSMPFCFLVQNFAEIGQLVDDLWPKKRFSRWRPPPSWIFKISIFGHVAATGFNIWLSDFSEISYEEAERQVDKWQKLQIFKIQHGGPPPFWKSLNRHISVKNCPILMKFGILHQILNPMTVTWPKIEIFKIQDGGVLSLTTALGTLSYLVTVSLILYHTTIQELRYRK